VNRNSARLLGLLLLIPSVFLALMPYLAGHTSMLNGMQEFSWYAGNQLIAEYSKDVNGQGLARTWWGVWVVAVLGEILLLGVYLFRPIERNRFKINIHG
jgi:hypothetical protein